MSIEVKFDYVSATFPLLVMGNDNERQIADEVLIMIANYLNVEGFEIFREDYSTNRYRYQYTLADHFILRLHGPVNSLGFHTCHLELKGEGCREFERRCPEKSWYDLFIYIATLNGSFKRLDIALDDFSGESITLSYILKKVLKKQYTSKFLSLAKPIGTIEEGLTLQFGSNKSPVELVMYDKLKEQLSRNKLVEHEYWTRYELRFRNDKAHSVVEQILDLEDMSDLSKFTYSHLYRVLDLKQKNNYNTRNQDKANTDKKWLKFLNNVEKATISSTPKVNSTFEVYLNFILPKVVLYLLITFLCAREDVELFTTTLFEMLKNNMNLNKHQFYRLNKHLNELHLNVLTDVELEELKSRIFSIAIDRSLPF